MSNDMTPRQRHRIDTSHYGIICSRCQKFHCPQCGVECQCPTEVRTFTLWLQDAINDHLAQLAEANPPLIGRAGMNAGRMSLTVRLNGNRQQGARAFRVQVEPAE